MGDTPESAHGAVWSHPSDPKSIQVAVMPSGESERIRDLEEGQRRHERQLDDHEEVMGGIETHLKAVVDQITKFKSYFLVGLVIIFGGTANGGKLVELIGKLFA